MTLTWFKEKPSWIAWEEYGHDPESDLSETPLMTRLHAADYLGISVKQLSDLAGNGPKGGKIEKVGGLYTKESVDEYKSTYSRNLKGV